MYLVNVNAKDATLTNKKSFNHAFKAFLKKEVDSKVPGYAVLVIKDEREIFKRIYGVKSTTDNTPIDQNTSFQLASLSKSFASLAMGKLIQESDVSWEDKIFKLIPGVDDANDVRFKEVTIAHLLSHSTGMVTHAYSNLIENGYSYNRLKKEMKKVPFICQPGECYGYQNVAYSLINDIFKSSTTGNYRQFLEKEILRPLGMKNTNVGYDHFLNTVNRATPHKWDSNRQQWIPVTITPHYYEVLPAAGVNSSISDMGIWLRTQLNQFPKVINPLIVNKAQTKQIKTSRRQAHYYSSNWNGVTNIGYALGWRKFDFEHLDDFTQHGGWLRGSRVEMVFNQQLKVGMVFLTNSESSVSSEIVPNFIKLAIDSKLVY